jgi:oligopeptide/dipeptide ABC transporter ATP-binding protein
MYAGRIVEQGPVRGVLEAPSHPYTIGLLHSRPGAGLPKTRLDAIPGTVPGLWSRPGGCAFHPRCSHVFERCRREAPPLFDMGEGKKSRCWLMERDGRQTF